MKCLPGVVTLVALVASLWRVPRRERDECCARLLELLALTEHADELCKGYSHGTRKKIHLAAVLTTAPRVLLLDEPTKGVDVGAKFEIHDAIRDLASGGLAVVLVSSDLPEVLAMADRVVVMREGRVQGELARAESSEIAVMRLATLQQQPSPISPAAEVAERS